MKQTIKWILLSLVFAVGLTGCFGNVKHEPVYITKVTVPEDALLEDCPVAEPPAKEIYMKVSLENREGLLTQHAADQRKNISKCNNQIKQLRAWKANTLKLEGEK